MIRWTLSCLVVAAAMVVTSSDSQAQIYVPHTTTHIDLVPHHGHLDAVPHSTTHFDLVPAPTYSSHYGSYGLGYNTGFGSSYNYNTGNGNYYSRQFNGYHSQPQYQNSYQHRSIHLDIVPHRGHYHVVPHTTTHRHRF